MISNTKGFTGHAMGVGIEDVVAIKAIETGIVPPVPNYKVPDPELGELNLSHGGTYPVRYALRLGAGFGSQVSMTLYRLVPSPTGRHPEPDELGFEYRIVDPEAWQSWLVASCGLPSAVTEISKRTLRIRDDGPPRRARRPCRRRSAAGLPSPHPSHRGTSRARACSHRAARSGRRRAGSGRRGVGPVAAESGGDGVEQQVLEIVAAQTGYPSDLLDLDLDLEADLGIDTVKQAETFAAIRAAYDIERDDRLALRDYPTLRHVIAFVYERAPGSPHPPHRTPRAPAPVAAEAAPVAAESGGDGVEQQVLEIVAAQTGYPSDLLDLDLDLEADLGIDTVKQAETFAAIRAAYDIERDDRLALRDYPTLRHVIAFVYERAPAPHRTHRTRHHRAARSGRRRVAPTAGLVEGDDAEAAAIPRRVPTAVLRPPLELCRPTGLTLGEGSRVVVMLDDGGRGRALIRPPRGEGGRRARRRGRAGRRGARRPPRRLRLRRPDQRRLLAAGPGRRAAGR